MMASARARSPDRAGLPATEIDDPPVIIQRRTKGGRTLWYQIQVLQQPERARACGSGAKSSADRRPVDPPPVVELRIFEGGPTFEHARQRDITFNYNASFFLYATLEHAHPTMPGRTMDQNTTPILTGMPVSGMAYLDRPSLAGYFLFPDLSVRFEGKYRLVFSLYEETKNDIDKDLGTPSLSGLVPGLAPGDDGTSFDYRMQIKSKEFTVYSAKKFPGLTESTKLSKTIAEQGCRVRIRRDVRMRRREAGGKGRGGDQDEDCCGNDGKTESHADDDGYSCRRPADTPDAALDDFRGRSMSGSTEMSHYSTDPARRPSMAEYPPQFAARVAAAPQAPYAHTQTRLMPTNGGPPLHPNHGGPPPLHSNHGVQPHPYARQPTSSIPPSPSYPTVNQHNGSPSYHTVHQHNGSPSYPTMSQHNGPYPAQSAYAPRLPAPPMTLLEHPMERRFSQHSAPFLPAGHDSRRSSHAYTTLPPLSSAPSSSSGLSLSQQEPRRTPHLPALLPPVSDLQRNTSSPIRSPTPGMAMSRSRSLVAPMMECLPPPKTGTKRGRDEAFFSEFNEAAPLKGGSRPEPSYRDIHEVDEPMVYKRADGTTRSQLTNEHWDRVLDEESLDGHVSQPMAGDAWRRGYERGDDLRRPAWPAVV